MFTETGIRNVSLPAFRAVFKAMVWATLAVFMAACASRPDFALSPAAHEQESGRVLLFDDNNNVILAANEDAVTRPGGSHPFNDSDGDGRRDYIILALSGGGAFGAYTAGVLQGWKEAGNRPEFDVINGVSTGALAGALAFVGDAYDPVLELVYTSVTRKDLFSIKPFGGVLSSSVADDKPLAATMNAIVTDAFVDRIAAEHAKGRRFYVATTNLDIGQTVIWNIGEIAATNNPNRVARIRLLLLASASVPVFFPPVFIPGDSETNGAMHVDGSVKSPILVRTFMLEAALREHRKRPLDLKVYTVVNGKILLNEKHDPVGPNLASIAASSIRTLYSTVTYKSLYQVYVSVRRAKGEFQLTYIPDDVELDSTAMSFDQADMRKLFELGKSRVLDDSAWQKEPPRLEPLERI